MARIFPAIDRLGEEPIMVIQTPFGEYRDKGGNPEKQILNVSGLDSVVKVGGGGSSGSVSITIDDNSGLAKAYMDSNNIHLQKVSVYQEFEDVGLGSVFLFDGQISSPISWDSSSNSISFEVVTKVEDYEIGFSVEEAEVITGDTIASDVRGRVPSDLVGKAWPLEFGSCTYVPTVKFSWIEDVDANDSEDDSEEVRKQEATIIDIGVEEYDIDDDEFVIKSREIWLPIEPTSVMQFVNAIKAVGVMTPGLQVLLGVAILDLEAKVGIWRPIPKLPKVGSVQGIQGIISNLNAWQAYSVLVKEFFKERAGSDTLKKQLSDVVFDWNNHKNNYDNFEAGAKKILAIQDGIEDAGEYADLQTNGLIEDISSFIVQGSFKHREFNVTLKKGHTFRNPKKLAPEDPLANLIKVNINGAKFATRILEPDDPGAYTPDVMVVETPLPICVNIPFTIEKDEIIRVRVTKNVKLDKMFCLTSGIPKFINEINLIHPQTVKLVIQVTNQEIETTKRPDDWDEEVDGPFIPEFLYSICTLTPILVFVEQTDVVPKDIRFKKVEEFEQKGRELRLYLASADVMEIGIFEEVYPFFMPAWMDLVDEGQFDWIDKTSLAFRRHSVDGNFALPTLLSNFSKLPKSSWKMQVGDKVTQWEGCPKAVEEESEEPDPDDEDAALRGKPWVHIANLIPDTIIHGVYAYKDQGGQNPDLVPVPSRYYSWGNATIVGKTCTVVKFPRELSSYEGEGWSDDIFVTETSPVGPNTAEIISWLVTEYGDNLTVDAPSFASVGALVEPFPSNFALFDRPQLLSILNEIAWQARCAVWLKDDVVYIKYLPQKGSAVSTIDASVIEVGSLNITLTETEDLVTKYMGEWHPTYQDKDSSGNDINRFVLLRNNENLYGVHDKEDNYFIYNIESCVRKSMEFWLLRWSNTWKRVSFNCFIETLDSETLDNVDVNLPAGILANSTVRCQADTIVYNSDNLLVSFDLWTSVRAGEMDEFDNAWLA